MLLRDALLFVLREIEKCEQSLSADKAWNIHSIIQDIADAKTIGEIDVDFSEGALALLCAQAAKDAIDDAMDFG